MERIDGNIANQQHSLTRMLLQVQLFSIKDIFQSREQHFFFSYNSVYQVSESSTKCLNIHKLNHVSNATREMGKAGKLLRANAIL